jgi:2-dehydropantoate 2-reductase
MKVCVYGAGAVGGMMAVLLAEAGHDVSIVARGEHLRAVRERGLALLIDGGRRTVRVPAAEDASQFGPQDLVIVAVKGPSLTAIAPQVSTLLGPETRVMTAMNGVPWWLFLRRRGPCAGLRLRSVDPGGVIEAHIPTDRVLGCVVHLANTVPEPGVIRNVVGKRFIVGEAGRAPAQQCRELAEALKAAGMTVELSDEIERDIWDKLQGNANLNPISTLTGATVDVMLYDPLTRELCLNMMREITELGRRVGVVPRMSAEDRLALAATLGAFKTSMLQDLEQRRPMEIDALQAALVEIADHAGVAVPYVRTVLGLTRQKAETLGLRPPPAPPPR